MIFYGPPGTGKTTVARIVASHYDDFTYFALNGTNMSTADIKAVRSEKNKSIIYIDEIQYLNKKQQQSLLEIIETGNVMLIASTTENPYFTIHNAVMSRSVVFEFKPVSPDDIIPLINKTIKKLIEEKNISALSLPADTVKHIAHSSSGDVRKAITLAELCVNMAQPHPDEPNRYFVAKEHLDSLGSNLNFNSGDVHYDLMSALQKSIRGSDPNAALYYAACLIKSGDLISLTRRLLVIAAEDIGLANPNAIVVTKACVDCALELGLPEARIPLSEAILLLATSPKSNSSEAAIDLALKDVNKYGILEIPRHLQNKHCDSSYANNTSQYLYPHNYPDNYVKQQYLPDVISQACYYNPGNNAAERQAADYWAYIKSKS